MQGDIARTRYAGIDLAGGVDVDVADAGDLERRIDGFDIFERGFAVLSEGGSDFALGDSYSFECVVKKSAILQEQGRLRFDPVPYEG